MSTQQGDVREAWEMGNVKCRGQQMPGDGTLNSLVYKKERPIEKSGQSTAARGTENAKAVG